MDTARAFPTDPSLLPYFFTAFLSTVHCALFTALTALFTASVIQITVSENSPLFGV